MTTTEPAELTATRRAHATHVITIGGLRILTDPGFTQTATYYHGERVTETVQSIGAVNAVVVTHEHYDHCDLEALVQGGFDLVKIGNDR